MSECYRTIQSSTCGKDPNLGVCNYEYINQLDTVYLPLGAGVYSPEQPLEQNLVMTVSVPTAMCIDSCSDQTAQPHTNLGFYSKGICCTVFWTNKTIMHYINMVQSSPSSLHIPYVTSWTSCTSMLSPLQHLAQSQCCQLAHFVRCEHHQLDGMSSHSISELSM